MKVKCKKILSNHRPDRKDRGNKTENLTVGKEYIVLSIYYNNEKILYQFESDCGELIYFEADQFDIVSNYIPSNWELIVKYRSTKTKDSSYIMELSPKQWNNASYSFYEDIHDVPTPLENWKHYPEADIPEVVKLYLQEKDIIHKEENEHYQRLQSKSIEF